MIGAPPSPKERQFDRGGGGKHSLARLETAMWWLEVDEVEVFDLIADHALVAFNLAGPGVERRLPGIWSHSLLECPQRVCGKPATWSGFPTHSPGQTGCSAGEGWGGSDDLTEKVLADILPPGQRNLRFGEVLFALGIKRRLLHVLLEAALVVGVPGTGDKVSKAPLITRASVGEFLTARRM
jgi:hypothetical protein